MSSDRVIENGVVYAVNDQPEQLDRLAGLGLTGDLAAAEAASWRRFLPGGKLPWSEVTESERRVEELERRRQETEARKLRLWSELYPSQEVGRQPPFGLLAGGLRRVLEKVGLENIVAAEQVYEALRDDLDWIATAASPEQRAKLEPRHATQDERERARDRQLDDAVRLRGQIAHDRRAGELAALKGRGR